MKQQEKKTVETVTLYIPGKGIEIQEIKEDSKDREKPINSIIWYGGFIGIVLLLLLGILFIVFLYSLRNCC